MNRKLLLIVAVGISLLGLGAEKIKAPDEIRLPQPWNKLNDLTDAQKVKLDAIHRAAREKQKAIEEQARQDMVAVLTPAQQGELRQIEDAATADRKLKSADRAPVDATTLPGRSLDD